MAGKGALRKRKRCPYRVSKQSIAPSHNLAIHTLQVDCSCKPVVIIIIIIIIIIIKIPNQAIASTPSVPHLTATNP
jgi:hypothetical protein